jgi:hypothetical protein
MARCRTLLRGYAEGKAGETEENADAGLAG